MHLKLNENIVCDIHSDSFGSQQIRFINTAIKPPVVWYITNDEGSWVSTDNDDLLALAVRTQPAQNHN